jgi:uncharacterized protein (TIGR02246 family)
MLARLTYSSFALAGLLAACATPAPQAAAPPAVDSAAVKAGVADLWQRWIAADTANNLDALADIVADSGRMDLKGVPPMIGRAGWRAAAEGMMKMVHYTSAAAMPEMTIAVTNELAYETGNFTEGSIQGKNKMMDYGRYAAALTKSADGKWRILYLIAFPDSTVKVK